MDSQATPEQSGDVPVAGSSEFTDSRAEERAWETYTQLQERVTQVDTKASILLAFLGILLAPILVSLEPGGRRLEGLNAWVQILLLVGLGATVYATWWAVMIVFPRGLSKPIGSVRASYLYFRAAASANPLQLEQIFAQCPVRMLASQCVVLGGIVEKKYRCLRQSMVATLVALVLLGSAAVVGFLS
ncbi:Pycsar system effector family protein [Buchananella felis]|uniref:Pycsar system effector family protein n=1 Tax=Buchananella felis TaxID=3231492 RepID=UPI00352962C2